MKNVGILFCLVLFGVGSTGLAAGTLDVGPIQKEIAQLQEEGRLAEANELVRKTLDENRSQLSDKDIQSLEYELDRSERIRQDYSVTESRLIELLKERIRDFTVEEFKKWEQEGRFDTKVIDGEKRYVGASRSNLFFRYPELKARDLKPGGTDFEQFLWNHYQEVISHFQAPAQSTVLKKHFQLKMTLTVDPDVVPEGKIIRCWMPYPQQFEAQSDVELIASTPEWIWMNAPRYPMRSLYFEQPSRGAQPTSFQAEYRMTTWARYNPIDPSRISPSTRTNPEALAFIREQPPHVLSTLEIEGLRREIAGSESNPYFLARKYYDWISKNIRYSYAREYSTLRNISMYVRDHRYGDCGQQTLLFITLCRASRIPARWQSGWMIHPPHRNLHDWAEIYLEPYGWIPVDVDFAQLIEQEYHSLSREQKDRLKDFYFGGLDAYRLVVNNNHGYPHYPPKHSPRSDDVDFQRGELEADGKNIYFNNFSYRLEVEYLDEADPASEQPEEPAGPTRPGRAR